MNSGGGDPQGEARQTGPGSRDALASAGLGTWWWNTATDAFGGDECCLQHIGVRGAPPRSFESLIRFVHPDDRPLVRAQLRATASARAATSFAFRVVGPDFALRSLQCLVAARPALPGDKGALLVGVLGPTGAPAPAAAADPRPDLQDLLHAAPVASAKFDRALRLVHANARFLDTLRLERFEWDGRTLYDALPEMPAAWRDAIGRCLEGADIQTAAEGFERADGSRERVDGQIYPWYDQDNEIGGVLLITQVRSSLADARFAQLVDQAPMGIAVSYQDGKVGYANAAWRALVGRGMDEVLGADALQHLHPDDRHERPPDAAGAGAGAGANAGREVRLRLPSGEMRWIKLFSRTLYDHGGESYGLIHAAVDITGRARHQRETGQMLAQLRSVVLHLDGLRDSDRTQTAATLQHGLYESLFELHAQLERWARNPAGVASAGVAARELALRSQSAVEQLRHVLFELAPPGVADLGFAGALQRFCSDFGVGGCVSVELALPARHIRADGDLLDVLYRVVREAVSAAAANRGATRVKVQVELLADAIRVRVEDNGSGGDAGTGLLAATLRVRNLGGSLRVLGLPGSATTVEVSVPARS